MKDIISNWRKVTNESDFTTFYNNIDIAEYFNSVVYAQHSGFYYKIEDDILYFIKPVFNFNRYTLTLYTKPICKNNNDINLDIFIDNGVSVRGDINIGTRDAFGKECVYDCDEFVKMSGSSFRKHRNRLKDYITNNNDYTTIYGDNDDVVNIIDKWGILKGNKSQKKLYKHILANLDKCVITTTYHKGIPLGFSVVEKINDKNGIIIQRLLNYDYDGVIEPNLILHYNDCINNKGKLLNIGASRNKGIKISKEKLRPKLYLDIRRKRTNVIISKDEYNSFKNNN